jgi:hypothetical protein
MGTSHVDAYEAGHDPDLQAQLCAYNTAFAELGLRFRWDARTLASLATIDTERGRIVAYIEAHHAHLLKAYSAEFLSQAVLEKKRAHYPACFATSAASGVSATSTPDISPAGARSARESYDSHLPALAGV